MPVKMISDMPLPMPRSLICSPSHMMNAVPGGERQNRQQHEAEARIDDDALLHRHQALRDAERLQDREDDGQIAGPLRDLAPAELAFLLQFLERRAPRRSSTAE